MRLTCEVLFPQPEDGSYPLKDCPEGTLGMVVSNRADLNGQTGYMTREGFQYHNVEVYFRRDHTFYNPANGIRIMPFPKGTKVTLTVS